jgi:2-polyprenyl-3-methyl-5-hydroxy-6-metoxy-1,4-benzoquinol methylase/tetratricopeptide (TPR) repeat protein
VMNKAAPAKQPPPELITQLQMALKFQKDGMLSEADNAYKKALKDYPDFPDAIHLAAIFYEQIGKTKYAITLLNKALAIKGSDAALLLLLAKCQISEDSYQDAVGKLDAARLLAPANAEIHYLKGFALYKMAQLSNAQYSFETAYSQKNSLPKHLLHDLYKHLSEIYIEKDSYDEALKILTEAEKLPLFDYELSARLALAKIETPPKAIVQALKTILHAPEKDEAKVILAYLCMIGTPKMASPAMEPALMACYQSKYVEYQSLYFLWERDFFSNRNPRAVQARDIESFDDFLRHTQQTGMECFYAPYFIESIKRMHALTLPTERLFTYIRRSYQERVAKGEKLGDQDLELLAAMAMQNHLNEYVFSVSESEQTFIDALMTQLNAEPEVADIQAFLLAGCYYPLRKLTQAAYLCNYPGPVYFKEVLTKQIAEPLEEQKIAQTLPSTSAIQDEVSKAVQQQYEENPYPRWDSVTLFSGFSADVVDKKFRKKINVLVAGCGTGKHILKSLTRHHNADITAVDLSKASLSYAQRKLREYGADKRVRLIHSDILDLGKLNQTFDYVECSGVLHHMKDPDAGLKILVKTDETWIEHQTGLLQHPSQKKRLSGTRSYSKGKYSFHAGRNQDSQRTAEAP